jgi:hypothetical protein
MGVAIEICIKYPGGPTRIRGTDIAGHGATRAQPKHMRDRDAPHTLARAWRTRRRAIGLRCYGYLDLRGH